MLIEVVEETEIYTAEADIPDPNLVRYEILLGVKKKKLSCMFLLNIRALKPEIKIIVIY